MTYVTFAPRLCTNKRTYSRNSFQFLISCISNDRNGCSKYARLDSMRNSWEWFKKQLGKITGKIWRNIFPFNKCNFLFSAEITVVFILFFFSSIHSLIICKKSEGWRKGLEEREDLKESSFTFPMKGGKVWHGMVTSTSLWNGKRVN